MSILFRFLKFCEDLFSRLFCNCVKREIKCDRVYILYLHACMAGQPGIRNMGREISDVRRGGVHVCSRAPSSWSAPPFLVLSSQCTHPSNLLGHLPFSAGWLLPKSEINFLQKGMNGIKEAILLTIKGDFDGFMKQSADYRNVIPCCLWLLFLCMSKPGLSAQCFPRQSFILLR